MVNLRFLPTGDPRLANTVDAIQEKLLQNGWLHRYDNDDGFGKPAVAFVLCSFWLVEALSSLGRQAEAAAVMERIHASLTPVGLLSEDYDPVSRRLSGNFPQAYSHVGLIHAAFAASPSWSEVL
jgi:GH15 family glucan-1,4-alpha-glucosidase